jgi:hypothetical protein
MSSCASVMAYSCVACAHGRLYNRISDSCFSFIVHVVTLFLGILSDSIIKVGTLEFGLEFGDCVIHDLRPDISIPICI